MSKRVGDVCDEYQLYCLINYIIFY